MLAELRGAIGFDYYVWVLTDPATCVGVSPLAEVPRMQDLPRLIGLKYRTAMNRWTSVPTGACATLRAATGGDLARSTWWGELLRDYGVVDVASMVHRDRFGTWGFLDLWRCAGTRPFTGDECRALAATGPATTDGIRRSHLRHAEPPTRRAGPAAGPAILVLTDELRETARTPAADAALRSLLPTADGDAPVPAAAFNVAAQLLATEQGVDGHPASARVRVPGTGYLTLTAARLTGDGGSPAPAMAVSIQPSTPAERLDLFVRAAGLTPREGELVDHVMGGGDTRELARRMRVGEHTVQDHLKAIFAKSGTGSRRELMARVTGLAEP